MKPNTRLIQTQTKKAPGLPVQARVMALSMAALFLAACGSDNTAVVVNPLVEGTNIPVSATTSSESAAIFVKQIVLAGGLEADDALTVGDVVLAKSETDEPDQTI